VERLDRVETSVDWHRTEAEMGRTMARANERAKGQVSNEEDGSVVATKGRKKSISSVCP
jgi:hypothetical protein